VDSFLGNYDLPQNQRTIVANYLGSMLHTQYYLSQVVDALRQSEEPVVLVLFGDHKPWLGNGNQLYHDLGINLSMDTTEGFYNYWSTRYLIWANDAAKEAVGHDMVGTGPDISPCFLMNVLFEQLGWEGEPYMRAMDEIRRELPVIHTSGAVITPEGSIVRKGELTPEQEELVGRFRCLEYYRQRHFNG